MEGYPHFNERLSNTTNEYAPDYYVAPEDRKDDMDALTEEEQKQYDEMLEKGLSAAFAAKYPQMDEIIAEAIGDEEKIAEIPLASREEKEEHAKKILEKQKKSFSQKYKAFSDPNFNKIIEKQKKEKEEKLKSTGIQDISQDIQNNNNKQ
jgi:lambda repressor-like predicted transcriptional regulator